MYCMKNTIKSPYMYVFAYCMNKSNIRMGKWWPNGNFWVHNSFLNWKEVYTLTLAHLQLDFSSSWCLQWIIFKHPSNVHDLVLRADLSLEQIYSFSAIHPIPSGNYGCGQCSQCNLTSKYNSFCHPNSGKVFKIKDITTLSIW